MEWQEILDDYRHQLNRIGESYSIHDGVLRRMLQKLASEEAREKLVIEAQLMGLYDTKLKEEPVKDGFRLYKGENDLTIYNFYDLYGQLCSIQNSSLATQPAIWFGHEKRMHLTQEMVRALLPLLNKFVEKGEIS